MLEHPTCQQKNKSNPGAYVTTKRSVLLVEPEYFTKYPPLGLMKISTSHKLQGDDVTFYKGTSALIRDRKWDLIYITTMFTFQWKITINTIKFYQRGRQKGANNIRVGGILATLLPEDIERETGIIPHIGLWDDVDRLAPDYDLTADFSDHYINNSSFGYMTKGCVNTCTFCAVRKLEPDFVHYIPLTHQVGPNKKDLILLDNNVLASNQFTRIIDEIKRHGFHKFARFGRSNRSIDFNQGIDARLLTEEKMALLSQIAINPLRIAFDNINLESLYREKVRLAHKYGINHLSNYILFNHKDTPEDFYRRLQINIELNEELGLSIFSFPMRYIPLDAKDRKYVGPNWTQTQLRGIQCILHATHGVVGPKRPFFEIAFGKTVDDFLYIIQQSEDQIFHREKMPPWRKID
jgi:hypothetical protein